MTRPAGLGRVPLLAAGLTLFVVLCTLNSAGYRYGASDQAFYAPAVIRALHPDYYPHDAPLIDAQARLTAVDEVTAALIRPSGLSLPVAFALFYAGGLVLFALGVMAVSRSLAFSGLTTVTLLAALTLRHAIAETGTNTLEGYFHPRQIAFALGVWAIAGFLRRRPALAALPLAAAALIHPTTALWFIIWLTVAFSVGDRRRMIRVAVVLLIGALAAAWALTRGPLAGRLDAMDPEWLATLSGKTYLFPLAWRWSVWLINLLSPALVLLVFLRRRREGRLVPCEAALVAGNLALLVVFLAALPLQAARVQLAIQLQPGRVFWMMDFLATAYVVWAMVESGGAARRRGVIVAVLIGLFTAGRSAYIAFVEFPARAMFAIGLPDGDWSRAMAWARGSAVSSHWLADPAHAFLYGSSLRVAGERDVFVEISKDQAIGMYDRPTAMRTRDRLAELGEFHSLTPERARQLATAHDLDYLVTTDRLELPIAFASGALTVYRLR